MDNISIYVNSNSNYNYSIVSPKYKYKEVTNYAMKTRYKMQIYVGLTDKLPLILFNNVTVKFYSNIKDLNPVFLIDESLKFIEMYEEHGLIQLNFKKKYERYNLEGAEYVKLYLKNNILSPKEKIERVKNITFKHS